MARPLERELSGDVGEAGSGFESSSPSRRLRRGCATHSQASMSISPRRMVGTSEMSLTQSISMQIGTPTCHWERTTGGQGCLHRPHQTAPPSLFALGGLTLSRLHTRSPHDLLASLYKYGAARASTTTTLLPFPSRRQSGWVDEAKLSGSPTSLPLLDTHAQQMSRAQETRQAWQGRESGRRDGEDGRAGHGGKEVLSRGGGHSETGRMEC